MNTTQWQDSRLHMQLQFQHLQISLSGLKWKLIFYVSSPNKKERLTGLKRVDSTHGLRKVGVVKRRRERRMQSQKGLKKVTKIGASCARNLGTEKDLQNVITLLKGQSMFMFVFFIWMLFLITSQITSFVF